MHWLIISLSVILVIVAFTYFRLNSSQANSGKELNASNCNTEGELVINVTEKVVKTVDSGQGGNNWAFDDLNRKIQVWRTGNDTYCALIENEGKFDSQERQKSPGNTAYLTGDEDGTFKGGYRAKIVGSMKEDPAWSTKGSVGTHAYNCDINGSCPGYVNWVDQYFSPGYKFSYEWWGWDYKYKNNTWTNSSDGNSGDII